MPYFIKVILYKLFYKHYIIKVINIIDKLINPIVIPQKHDKYTSKFFDRIGDGGRVKAITRTASAVKNHTMLDFLDRYYLSQHISVR
jgi:hypothetical protein